MTTTDRATPSHPSEPDGRRGMDRRQLLLTGIGGLAVGGLSVGAVAAGQAGDAAEDAAGTARAAGDAAASVADTTWDKTFPRSSRVDHEKVTFPNRLGITLAADVYAPRGARAGSALRALVVGHPFGGVKEQSSGLYAQTMAERGFVTVAFDASYGGESGGTPHAIASPEAFVEDFSAAVDFLGMHPLVDRERIGVIGICGSGGFSLAAAEVDARMKAVATVTMYDMGRDRRQSLGDTLSEEDRRQQVVEMGRQRWIEAEGGEKQYVMGTPETITADSPDVAKEFYAYYRTPRGQHPRSTTEMSLTSNGALMQFSPFPTLPWISPRPILLVHGEVANSRYFSEDAYQRAAEPKELLIVRGAGHVDLYDRVDLIPWDRLTSFFTDAL